MQAYTFKSRDGLTGLGFRAMAPLEAITAPHAAVCLLFNSWANFMLAHHQRIDADLRGYKQINWTCVPDICNPALLFNEGGEHAVLCGPFKFHYSNPPSDCAVQPHLNMSL